MSPTLCAALYRSVTEKHDFYSCETVRSDVQTQFIRDFKVGWTGSDILLTLQLICVLNLFRAPSCRSSTRIQSWARSTSLTFKGLAGRYMITPVVTYTTMESCQQDQPPMTKVIMTQGPVLLMRAQLRWSRQRWPSNLRTLWAVRFAWTTVSMHCSMPVDMWSPVWSVPGSVIVVRFVGRRWPPFESSFFLRSFERQQGPNEVTKVINNVIIKDGMYIL